MQCKKIDDETIVTQLVPREVTRKFRAKPVGNVVDRGRRDVERTIAPLGAAPHPTGMWLARIERQELGSLNTADHVAAFDLGAAGFRCNDDKTVMNVWRELLRFEVGAHQG